MDEDLFSSVKSSVSEYIRSNYDESLSLCGVAKEYETMLRSICTTAINRRRTQDHANVIILQSSSIEDVTFDEITEGIEDDINAIITGINEHVRDESSWYTALFENYTPFKQLESLTETRLYDAGLQFVQGSIANDRFCDAVSVYIQSLVEDCIHAGNLKNRYRASFITRTQKDVIRISRSVGLGEFTDHYTQKMWNVFSQV